MPPRKTHPRQSLLFSATIPPGIREVADLDPNHVIINTLKPGEENTHEHVPQEYVLVSTVDMFPATLSFLEQSFQRDSSGSKVILFFSTARLTGLFYALLQALQAQSQGSSPLHNVPLFELHSRKSQAARGKASKAFGEAVRGILCSSDVTARGVDFPGVTQVIQVGLPANGEQYIHRLGRTARECHRSRSLSLFPHKERNDG
jgi:ATP-dependent RNA helicase MSS116